MIGSLNGRLAERAMLVDSSDYSTILNTKSDKWMVNKKKMQQKKKL